MTGARYILHVPDIEEPNLSDCRFYVVTEEPDVPEDQWDMLACCLDGDAARILLPAIDYIVRRMEAAVLLQSLAEKATLDVPDYVDEIQWEAEDGSSGND